VGKNSVEINQLPVIDIEVFNPLLHSSNAHSTAHKANLLEVSNGTLIRVERFSQIAATETAFGLALAAVDASTTSLSGNNLQDHHQAVDNLLFRSGVFTVGSTGEVEIDYLLDGGGFQGELAIFSLEGLTGFAFDSQTIIQQIAQRALSNSPLGHIVISDQWKVLVSAACLRGRRFQYWRLPGCKRFSDASGDRFGVMLVPNGTVEQVLEQPSFDGALRPCSRSQRPIPATPFICSRSQMCSARAAPLS
jgi:hypothetical protein